MSSCGSETTCYQQVVSLGNELYNGSIYSPWIFPYAYSGHTLNVIVLVNIFKLLALTNDKILSVAMEVDLSWYDPNIPMDWRQVNGSFELATNSSSVWTMNLYLKDPASASMYLSPENLVFLSPPPSGSLGARVQTNTIGDFQVTCQGMTLYAFPFDSQSCVMQLLYGDTYFQQVNYVISPSSIYVSNVASSDEWTVTNVSYSSLQTVIVNTGQAGAIFGLVFNLTRNSYYYQISLIYPTVILQAAAALTFFLPSDHGEKVILGATLILAVYVLQNQLTSLLPQFSDSDVPLLVTALMVGFILTGLSLFESVLMQTARIVAPDLPKSFNLALDRAFRKCCQIVPVLNTSANASVANLSDGNNSISLNGVAIQDSGVPYDSGDPAVTGNRTVFLLGEILKTQRDLLEEQKKRAFLKSQADAKQEHDLAVEQAWRRIEYVVNLVTLLIYVTVIVYYFGFYIYD